MQDEGTCISEAATCSICWVDILIVGGRDRCLTRLHRSGRFTVLCFPLPRAYKAKLKNQARDASPSLSIHRVRTVI